MLNKLLKFGFPLLDITKTGQKYKLPLSILLLPQWWHCVIATDVPMGSLRALSGQAISSEPKKQIAPKISSIKDIETNLNGLFDANKTLALLLDYDGTLASIAPNSKDTYLTESMFYVLQRLANDPRIFMAIISGRALDDVKCRVNLTGITYSGNHGMEIEMYDGKRLDYELPEEIRINYDKLLTEMRSTLEKNGSWIEDKKISLTYHYRHAPPEMQKDQMETAMRLIELYGYRILKAHGAVEGKPPLDWDKGKAAKCILKSRFGDNWSQKPINVFFAGDDYTDEDAMKELQGIAKSFRISSNANIKTYADYRLEKMELMEEFFNWICKIYNIQ